MNKYYGFSAQDYFVMKMLNNKEGGWFLELGTNHPMGVNNTFLLEHKLGWKGLMIEYDNTYEHLYPVYRPRSRYLIADARKIDYVSELKNWNFPKDIDYLSFDLEADNRSTLEVLELFDATLLDEYRFATITFEHDVYRGDFFETRKKSREILEKRGYVLVFADVMCNETYGPYEDWYVHPALVDMERVAKVKTTESLHHLKIEQILDQI